MPRIRPRFADLATDRRSVVALEYAFIGTACLALGMGVLQVGFGLYAKVALNYAATTTARQLQTGGAKEAAKAGMPNLTALTICPAMAGLLDCNAVTVSLYPVSDYLPGSELPFDPGMSKSLMLLRLTYTAPIPVWPLLGTSSAPLLITTSVPFVNEYNP